MKITFRVVAIALLVGFLAAIGYWAWIVTHSFAVPASQWRSMPVWLIQTFSIPALFWIGLRSLAVGIVTVCGILWMLHALAPQDNQRFVRGTRVVSVHELKRLTKVKRRWMGDKTSTVQISFAGAPIPLDCEPNHFLLVGSTNTGKSTAIDQLLASALQRGDRCIVIDPNGHAFARFGQKADRLFNPFDARSPGWSIFNELRKPYDYERLAMSIIPDTGNSDSQQWRSYARTLFIETARMLARDGETTNERLVFWLTKAPLSELRKFLKGSPAEGLFEPGADKALAGTRFILTEQLEPLQHLRDGKFSLRNWLESGNGNLFITWREDMLEALRPLVTCWADVLIANVLTMPTEHPRPLWFVLDELASLGCLSSLNAGLTKGRKHGLRVVAGLQSVSQLDALYGHDNAITLRSCFRNLLVLGCSNADPDTARMISEGLGQTESERIQKTTNDNSRERSTSVSRQRNIEYAVLPSELMALRPLHGFLKLAGAFPVAKINLVYQEFKPVNRPFVEA